MAIQWIESPNRDKGREGFKPEAIVIHIMEGTLKGTDGWFSNEESGVSAHYGIGKETTKGSGCVGAKPEESRE